MNNAFKHSKTSPKAQARIIVEKAIANGETIDVVLNRYVGFFQSEIELQFNIRGYYRKVDENETHTSN